MGKFNLAKFNNKHFLVLAGNGMLSVTGLATSYLLFNYLTPANAGIYYVLLSFVSLCEAARYGLLSTTTIKFYAGTTPERGATVLGSVWVIALGLTAIILLANAGALLFLPYTHNIEVILSIKWIGITYLSTLPADIVFWRLQSDEKYGKLVWYRMVNSASTILAFFVLILLHKMTLHNALLYNFLTNCLCSVVGVVFNMSGLKYLLKTTRQCISEMLNYGKYTLMTTSCSVLLGSADVLIINSVLGPAAVAVYNLSIRLMAINDLPLRSLVTTGMSEMAILQNQNNMPQFTYIFKKYAGMLTIAFIPIAVVAVLFGNVVNMFGGVQYHGSIAANAFRLFMVIAILYPIDNFNGLALDLIGKTKINFYKVLIMLGIKIIADFAGLAMFHNIYGIAFSLLLVTLAGIGYGYYQLRKDLTYTIPGIISLGYHEIRLLIRKNLKASA